MIININYFIIACGTHTNEWYTNASHNLFGNTIIW